MQYPYIFISISSPRKWVDFIHALTRQFVALSQQTLAVVALVLGLLSNVMQAVPLVNIEETPRNAVNFYNLKNSSPFTELANLNETGAKLDPQFNPTVETAFGDARAVLLQSDGKVLVAGNFKSFNGVRRNGIVRLNTDQSLDLGFDANIDGFVNSIAQQSDGKIIVGGNFTAVGGVSKNYFARLNSDGSVDQTFNSGTGANGTVFDIVVLSDGKLLIAGSFTSVNSVFRNCIARLNADGSIDTTFASPFPPTPPPSPFPPSLPYIPSIVYSMAIQSDGNILVGGFIVTHYDPQIVYSVLRLDSNGSYDNSFVPPAINSNVNRIVLQPDGKILISGFFGHVNGVERRYLARLNATGSLDASFDATGQAVAPVYSIYLKNDGKVLFGSIISTTGAVMKQLNPSGSLDVAFTTNEFIPGMTYAITPLSNGKILAVGSISGASDGESNTALIFNANGTQDELFQANFQSKGRVRAVAVQNDGKILIGGIFNRVNGSTRSMLSRLNANGSIDEGFVTSFLFAAQITVIVVQPDGKILVGGSGLTSGSGQGKSMLRLNSNGSLDETFTQTEFPFVTAKTITVQSDGKILLSYLSGSRPGQESGGLARFNANGSLDSTFEPTPNFPFDTVIALANGQIIAGGEFGFGYVNPPTPTEFHNGVVRLDANGSHDRTFRSGLVAEIGRFSSVKKILIQDDGKLLVGGSLYTGGSSTPVAVVRLNSTGSVDGTFQQSIITSGYETPRVEDMSILQNGNLVIGGLFNSIGGIARGNLALLSPDGSVDSVFNAFSDNTVFETELQNDGRILIGGDFDSLNGVSRSALGRLVGSFSTNNAAPFDFDGDGKTDVGIYRPAGGEWWWQRSSDGVVPAVQFGNSTDVIAPGDFTGDGKLDHAFFRPSDGFWHFLRSEDFTYYAFPFGQAGDVPVTGDYDGDGKADVAVFRGGTWYIARSSDGGTTITGFGVAGDVPVTADYDGDGKDDIGIYRPNGATGGEWWINRSTAGLLAMQFGGATDKTVPGDYTGDGKADIAFWRPSTGEWYIVRSEDSSYYAFPFGQTGDVPAPGDYDGDGKMDAAVFRNGTWYIAGSTSGTQIFGFGVTGDRPIPNSFVRQ